MIDLVIFAAGKAKDSKQIALSCTIYPLNTNTLDKLLIATRHVHRLLTSPPSADMDATVASISSVFDEHLGE
ncbi:hypothetical protein HQ40_00195 [Porphyromonas gulae]|uniref:Uncharacterized protein n=1 Tax=Porphyromonas gulae TaxID=111105 RepID=A0A0A2DRZ7_9PORP|nr:hypothetical protein [Porphyromonas gulae]KGN69393.1 hypothetical protein HR09_04425 [Porphyromonas gulae]KGN77789.1 hypothetical protein HQ40_00195 [Porphyromonas gulae]KGN87475.1 hypothetical protein HR08_02095 [Porphyromonas gulae]